jgi:heme oxygenase
MSIQANRVEQEPTSERGARNDILARLKLETAAEHAAVERATGVMQPGLTLAEYALYLERTLGFYLPVEETLRRMAVWSALGLAAEERVKSMFLTRDLSLLGRESARDVVCDSPPQLAGLPEAVGCAYVLEGSTLGGRVISRHVQRRFGPAVPRGFLECYGARTGESWQEFRAALQRFADTREVENRVIGGARETFRAFTRWLAQPAVPPTSPLAQTSSPGDVRRRC